MSVEVNTWLLIARRLFNKNGIGVWEMGESKFQVKLISIGFYATWIFIRLVVYPALFFAIWDGYLARSKVVGSYWHALLVAPILQIVFIVLNLKWSWDLLKSKFRSDDVGPSKGL